MSTFVATSQARDNATLPRSAFVDHEPFYLPLQVDNLTLLTARELPDTFDFILRLGHRYTWETMHVIDFSKRKDLANLTVPAAIYTSIRPTPEHNPIKQLEKTANMPGRKKRLIYIVHGVEDIKQDNFSLRTFLQDLKKFAKSQGVLVIVVMRSNRDYFTKSGQPITLLEPFRIMPIFTQYIHCERKLNTSTARWVFNHGLDAALPGGQLPSPISFPALGAMAPLSSLIHEIELRIKMATVVASRVSISGDFYPTKVNEAEVAQTRTVSMAETFSMEDTLNWVEENIRTLDDVADYIVFFSLKQIDKSVEGWIPKIIFNLFDDLKDLHTRAVEESGTRYGLSS